MLVSLTITVLVMAGVLTLFQASGKIAKTQTDVSDMQQNLRIALYDTQRYARMAGRGGLPASLAPSPGFGGHLLPEGAAIAVTNNVPAGSAIGGAGTPEIVEGTDVLTVRGVLFGSVYQSEISTTGFANNQITVGALSAMGVVQDIGPLADAVDDATSDPEALILVSPMGSSLYSVVELTGGNVDRDPSSGEVRGVTLSFTRSGGTRQSDYLQLMPDAAFPAQMTSAAYVGVLEEYRYYVRKSSIDPSNPASLQTPRLSRARFYPGTQVVHPSNRYAQEDIADNVLDLQIALGIDLDRDGQLEEGTDASQLASDEWLFNDENDVLDDPNDPRGWVWNSGGRLELLRLTALVRTDRTDVKFIAPPIDRIEDHLWNEPATPPARDVRDRRFRRRQIRSVIDFRNL